MRLPVLLALTLPFPAAPAQSPVLVRDLETQGPVRPITSSDPQGFSAVGNLALFSARRGDTGRELFVTGGAASGARLLADLVPGRAGSDPTGFTPFRGGWLFAAGADVDAANGDGETADPARPRQLLLTTSLLFK